MRCSSYLAFVIPVVFAFNAAAQQNQPTYDAGALMRQTEQMMRQNQLQQAAQKRAALPPAAVFNETTSIQVERFKFNGNRLLTTAQLQTLVASFANRALNQHDLERLTETISDAYRQLGWLVQVYIPKQDLSGSELTVQVVESLPHK
jgi:hemolysin activation/secretion protein